MSKYYLTKVTSNRNENPVVIEKETSKTTNCESNYFLYCKY